MTVLVEQTATTGTPEPVREALAPWHSRVGAFAIDVAPGAAVIATMALVSFTVPARGVWWWVGVCVLGVVTLLVLVNRLLLPVITGWSLGRALAGIAVTPRTGAAPGPWRLLLRDLAHLLDTASIVGWLWPLWDSRRRTSVPASMSANVRRRESHSGQSHPTTDAVSSRRASARSSTRHAPGAAPVPGVTGMPGRPRPPPHPATPRAPTASTRANTAPT
ncbi:RDD family protein, partial [Mycobacterium avium]|uniref:RDD family protein n=1 Tax=Mycobacterium avium TaxID=1764 RepID=UPI001EE76EBB